MALTLYKSINSNKKSDTIKLDDIILLVNRFAEENGFSINRDRVLDFIKVSQFCGVESAFHNELVDDFGDEVTIPESSVWVGLNENGGTITLKINVFDEERENSRKEFCEALLLCDVFRLEPEVGGNNICMVFEIDGLWDRQG